MERKRISVGQAILLGQLVVNGPVTLLLLGFPIAVISTAKWTHVPDAFLCLSVPSGLVLAWTWWSLAAPRWRLWAMQHVDDLGQLMTAAVRAQLIWPRGHFFERTEIQSRRHSWQESTLELRYHLPRWREGIAPLRERRPPLPELERVDRALAGLAAHLAADPAYEDRAACEMSMEELRQSLAAARALDLPPGLPEVVDLLLDLLSRLQDLM